MCILCYLSPVEVGQYYGIGPHLGVFPSVLYHFRIDSPPRMR